MKWIKYILLIIVLYASPAFSADYYVATTGNDATGDGSIGTPWQTIDKCANTVIAGDTCIVRAGTYDESVTPTNDGSAGNLITYMAYPGETVTVRQFALSDDDYIRITGFTFTHTDTTYNRAVLLLDSDYCQILGNTFDHLNGQAVYSSSTNPATYAIIRGNTIRFIGCPTGEGLCDGLPGVGIYLYGDYNLIEYNSFEQDPDFVNISGSYNIVRNNFMDSFDEASFPDIAPGTIHVDIFQPYSPSTRNFFENNWSKDNIEADGHYMHLENDHTYNVWRGNVGVRFGSYIIDVYAGDNLMFYNNTWVDFTREAPDRINAVYFTENAGNFSNDNFAFNNLFYSVNNPSTGIVFTVTEGSTATFSNNLCYNSGTHASCVSTADPVFVNYATDDLHIQTTSPAKNTGKAVTLVNDGDGGTGTEFVVDDSGYFTSGFGITTGDKIKVGTNPVTTITGIVYATHTITVADSITWADNDEVILGQVGNASKDIGTFPHYASGYALTGTYTVSAGVVTVTPSDASLVRFVEVWEDGTPIGTDSTSPYTISGVGNGTLSVKIYSLYASETPIVTATRKSGMVLNSGPAFTFTGPAITLN